MKTKLFFGIILSVFIVLTAGCKKDNDIVDNPNKLLKQVTVKQSKDGVPTDTMQINYTYDSQKRITLMQMFDVNGKGVATPTGKFEYTYNTDNRVSKLRVVAADSKFYEAVFTYSSAGEITHITYGGAMSGMTADIAYISGRGYVFSSGTKTFMFQASYANNTFSKIQFSDDVYYIFKYDDTLKNSFANLGAQISIPTFFFFAGYSPEGLIIMPLYYPNAFNAGVLKEIEVSKGGMLFQYSSEKDQLGFITKTEVNAMEKTITATYTYQ